MRNARWLALVGVVVGSVLSPSVDAEANYRSINSTVCVPVSPAGAAFTYGDPGMNMYDGQVLNTTAANLFTVCPIPEDTTVDLTSPTASLKVYGFANGAAVTVQAQACHTKRGGGGGACGAAQGAGANTTFTLSSFDMSGWEGYTGASSADSFYVYAELGPQTSGSDNVLFGFFVAE